MMSSTPLASMPAGGETCSRAASPLVITGMHRSGTSLAAALLRSSGVAIGHRLLRLGPELGYAEDLDFVELHQDMLRDRGASSSGYTLGADLEVDAARTASARNLVAAKSGRGPWGFKDPRTTLFLPFWHRMLPRACFVLVYRAPWAVVDSLYRRGEFAFFWTPVLAVQLWIHYNRCLVEMARCAPERCLVASVDAISRRPGDWIAALGERFGLELNAPDADLVDRTLLCDAPPCPSHLAAIRDAHPEALALHSELRALDAMSTVSLDDHLRLPDDESSGTAHTDDPHVALAAWMEERRAEALAAGRTGWGSE